MDGSKKAGLADQVRRFRARFVQSAGAALGKVLTAQVLKNTVLEETGSWRERLYGPLTTLVLFIEQALGADHSCQDAVARGLSTRVAMGQAPCSLNTGPYCKARARLALGLIEHLGREVAARLCAAQPAPWLWHGRAVKLVDGTTVSMPDTESNQLAFPQSQEQKPGLGFPLARLLGIVSLSCGAVLEWASGPCEGKNSGETALLWRLMDKLAAGDVVVADRYFAGYFAIARLRQLGVDVLIRQHQRRHTDFRRGQRLGKRDHVVSWSRPQRPSWMDAATYALMPESIVMREVRLADLTLVTTLLDDKEVEKARAGRSLRHALADRTGLSCDQDDDADGRAALQKSGHGTKENRGAPAGLQPGAGRHGAGGVSCSSSAASIELQGDAASGPRLRGKPAPQPACPAAHQPCDCLGLHWPNGSARPAQSRRAPSRQVHRPKPTHY